MKIKYVTMGFAVLLSFIMLFATEAQASQPAEFLIRRYTINLTVDDLQEAFLQIDNMPGLTLGSFINIQSGFSDVQLLVDNQDLDEVLLLLHSLGDVSGVISSARNVFSEVSDLRLQLQVRNDERTRLMELLTEVETLESFRAVEDRLVQVIGNIEFINGRLDLLNLETGTSRIDVILFTQEGVFTNGFVPDIERASAFGRIGGAFVDSAGFTLSMIQWMLLIFAYVSIPAATILLVGGGITLFAVKYKKRTVKNTPENKSVPENKSAPEKELNDDQAE